jgi:predicted MFS family arabinose efflux permease
VGAYVNTMLLPTAIFGPFFFITQYLQEVRGFEPLQAGLAFLPQTLATVIAVRFAPRLMARYGAVRMLLAGGLLIVSGVAWLTRIGPDGTYAGSVLVPLMLIGTGVGWSFMPLNVTILAGVPGSEAGAASAVAQSMQWVGGSLGLAIMVTVFGAASKIGSAAGGAAAGGSVATAAELFTRGVSSALTVGVVFGLATMILTATVIARRRTGVVAGAESSEEVFDQSVEELAA